MYGNELTEDRISNWPYAVHYDKENEQICDVLVLGGGLAGCHAAINATKKGAKVIVVDKAAVIRSGSGGAGIDHWHHACTNPCCKVTPEEMVNSFGKYSFGHSNYIVCKESWDALLDVEKMGIEFRDVDNEFAGAEFSDEKTKIMFAYDYENKHTIRLRGGANMKPALYRELKRLGVEIYDRVMVTSLLNEGGKPGNRIVGATGVNVRTGEFYVFKAKATVLSLSTPTRLWIFSTELVGYGDENWDPLNAGDGYAMAWKAGAEFTVMEGSRGRCPGGLSHVTYGFGGSHNTWYACTLVDANGKEIPWIDRDGKVLKTVSERYRLAPGQKFTLHGPATLPYEYRFSFLIPDLLERMEKGEFIQPFYADLPGMPEHERRAIFGLMVGNEGKTRVPIYDLYTKAGFDPDKDMLEVPVYPTDPACFGSDYGKNMGPGPAQWRVMSGGWPVVDWDLKTSLEGLYTTSGGAAGASATGRYAGRKAAACALKARELVVDRQQVEDEKARIYAPVNRKDGVGWKELQAGLCRIMQDYCGEYKSEESLKTGLRWLNSIKESEASRTHARNPHELRHTLECMVRLTVGEMIMHACLARRASSSALNFKRVDYPEMDPPEWDKFVTIRLENGEVKVGELPFRYWLLPPNASTFEQNYQQHCSL
jgi:succinate dehydrogenase/fumarate reductase flavoprotein subunit